MNDAIRQPIKVPTWQIPYLEKHRIMQLFHEIARELVIQKPKDHVIFIKQILLSAVANRDNARVIILCSPKVNCLEVALAVVQITKQIIITRESLMNYLGKDKIDHLTPELNIKYISRLLMKENAYNFGWIMLGCIRNRRDATALLQAGIIPTHVIHLIPPFQSKLTELIYCNVHADWPEYRRVVMGIREVFKSVLLEVYLNQRPIEEIVNECVELIKVRPQKIQLKPRVVLIGPRGSGRKTQAKLLAQNLDIVYVDFEYLICQAWMSESELGANLRKCKSHACLHSELLAEVINKRILEEDCLNKGWVLTTFPYSDYDFKCLDCVDTPPNRVIFLECDLNICKERMQHRKVNVYSGSVTNIKDASNIEGKQLETHPKDNITMIDAELSYYCQNYESLRDYCGETASVINADQSERWVQECILAVIYKDSPVAPPREPFPVLSTVSSSFCCTPVPSEISNYIKAHHSKSAIL